MTSQRAGRRKRGREGEGMPDLRSHMWDLPEGGPGRLKAHLGTSKFRNSLRN